MESEGGLSADVLVAATRRLISEEGLDAVSVRRLAAAVGVTAPALYVHVRGKGDLLRRVAEQRFAELAARFAAVEADDPIDRMRAMAKEYVAVARAEPELFRVMLLFPPVLDPLHSAAQELPAATAAFETAVAPAREAAAQGRLRPGVDPLAMAIGTWMAAHGAATTLLLGFEVDDAVAEDLVDGLLDAVLRGYAAG